MRNNLVSIRLCFVNFYTWLSVIKSKKLPWIVDCWLSSVNFAIRVALLTTINGKANINTAVIATNAGISQGALNIYYQYKPHIIYIGWISRNFKTFIFKPELSFWGKITKMITRVHSRIFTNSPYMIFAIFMKTAISIKANFVKN